MHKSGKFFIVNPIFIVIPIVIILISIVPVIHAVVIPWPSITSLDTPLLLPSHLKSSRSEKDQDFSPRNFTAHRTRPLPTYLVSM